MGDMMGRDEEIKILNAFINSKHPEFLVLYGRIRIGKTFLIENFFKDKQLIFLNVTGENDAPMKNQIKHFMTQMSAVFYRGAQLIPGKNWDEAFEILTKAFETVGKNEKIVLFFDEFPWMATQNSRLLQGLDYYWNQFWSNDNRIKLIICGSSASWIVDNIVNNKAGLHNRITKHINLQPLNLPETKKFLKNEGIILSNRHIVDLYMSMGGIPYYLSQIEKEKSSTQMIESLAFKRKGFLLTEFNNLFASLFKNSGVYEEIIKTIASYRYGIGKRELLEKVSKSLVGKSGLEKLKVLEDAGFILDFKSHLHKEKGVYYKCIDHYLLFYFYWIFPVQETFLTKSLAKGYWDKMKKSPSWHRWAELAFGALCYDHLPQISQALDLSPLAIPSTWRYTPRKNTQDNGAHIDLLFDRDDDAFTICEIKYTDIPYTITKEYAEKLQKN